MKASDFLTEAFNSNVKGKVVRRTADVFSTEALIGSRTIKFTASNNHGNWEVAFHERMPTKGYTYSKTGSGSELQVFSFVIESLKTFVSIYSPETISFTSDKSDGNRSKLYNRLSKRVKLPGYHFETDGQFSSGYDVFYIVRDK
jgi:hypothetical protein